MVAQFGTDDGPLLVDGEDFPFFVGVDKEGSLHVYSNVCYLHAMHALGEVLKSLMLAMHEYPNPPCAYQECPNHGVDGGG